VRDLVLPDGCLLTTARRGDKVILLHGNTMIQVGDRIVALTDPACVQKLHEAFRPVEEAPTSAASGSKRLPEEEI
jgi:Trk K+ transport system NAD-binding subunit